MLLNDFYTLQRTVKVTDKEYDTYIRINAEHPIFKGHFPDKPVTPGVCMLQIIKEIISELTREKLNFISASHIKFKALINPFKTPDLRVNLIIEQLDNDVMVKSRSYFGETEALSLNVKYQML